jgi:hypothetical protein
VSCKIIQNLSKPYKESHAQPQAAADSLLGFGTRPNLKNLLKHKQDDNLLLPSIASLMGVP